MGFFSSLLKIAGPIARTVLGIPAAAAPVMAKSARAVATTATALARSPAMRTVAATAVGTGVALAVVPGAVPAPVAGIQALPAIAGAISLGARARGGMKNRLQTTIQTIAPDGTVLETEVREGRPFLMRSDFVIAKRVRKLIVKAKVKIAPSARQESEQTKLMKAVVTTATRRVLTGPDCPPKC